MNPKESLDSFIREHRTRESKLDAPNKIRFPGLPHGSANKVIFQDLLGYSPQEIEQLKAGKAV